MIEDSKSNGFEFSDDLVERKAQLEKLITIDEGSDNSEIEDSFDKLKAQSPRLNG